MNEQESNFEWKGEIYWRNLNRSLMALSYLYLTYNSIQQEFPFWTTIASGGAFLAFGAKEAIERKKFRNVVEKRGDETVCNDCELPCPLMKAVKKLEIDGEDQLTGNQISNEIYNSLQPSGNIRKAEFKLEDGYPRRIRIQPNPSPTKDYLFECKLQIE